MIPFYLFAQSFQVTQCYNNGNLCSQNPLDCKGGVATDAQGLPVHLKELFEKAHIDYFADRYLSKSILDKLFERKDTKETLPNVVIKNVKPNKVSTISRMFSGTYTKSIGTEQSPNIEPSTENQVDMSSPKSSNKSKRKNKNGQ